MDMGKFYMSLLYAICHPSIAIGKEYIGGFMSYLRYLCLFWYSGVQHILCCVFVLFFFVLCTIYMLPVSLDCPFVISPSIFSNVYIEVFTVCFTYMSSVVTLL